MNIDDFLFDDQRARIKRFQSWPLWKQYLSLPIGLAAALFQVIVNSLNNGLSITLILLVAKPADNFRRWRALKNEQLYTSFFD